MSSVELFTREEVLAGLPAKRARALMFLIERRSADLAARDGEIAAWMATATLEAPMPLLAAQLWVEKELLDASGERSDSARVQPGDADDAFLRAFGQSRSPCASIGQIERYAHEWAPLVPDNPRLRAAVARLLGQKYRFTQRSIPGIRRVLGLDEPAVQRAYERQYGEPLQGIYAPQVRPSERLRWLMVGVGKWLDRLPPFWFAFAFTLTETVGMSILALPIALALVGPLPGIAILALLAAINLLTVLCQAEAVVRSGTIRSRHAFFGRLVADYLGKTGSLFFSAFLWIMGFLALQNLYIGFSTALADATQISPMVWAPGLFAACLYFVSRPTLHATAASALLIGAVNIGLILGLSALALAHLKVENLRYAQFPFVAGRPFDPKILSLVFGVGMAAYFGHISIGNSARLVLARDPSGRGLIGGSVAATGTAFLLNALFLVTVQGAVGPRALAGYAGTALEPLAHVAGPGTWVLGSSYVILGLGMTAVHVSFWLYNLVGERLPPRPHFLAVLRVGGERLLLEVPTVAGDGPRIGLSYLGLDGGRARFRVEFQTQTGLHARETTIEERWEIGELPGGVPVLRGERVRLELQLVEANPESVRFVAHSNLRVTCEAETEGRGVLGLFELPDGLWEILPWVLRRGEVTLAEATGHLRQDETAVRESLDSLVSHGVLQRAGDDTEPRYRARAARRRPRVLPDRLQTALEELEGTTGRCRRRGRVPARAKRGEGAATGRRGDKTSPAMTTSLRSALPPRLPVSSSPAAPSGGAVGRAGTSVPLCQPAGRRVAADGVAVLSQQSEFHGLSQFQGADPDLRAGRDLPSSAPCRQPAQGGGRIEFRLALARQPVGAGGALPDLPGCPPRAWSVPLAESAGARGGARDRRADGGRHRGDGTPGRLRSAHGRGVVRRPSGGTALPLLHPGGGAAAGGAGTAGLRG
jgi:hypothetical protein